ncbi:hypothetical protein [Nocardioides euryhalodurans]|uniref:hypothetical protein n=1 Tax=Nocardioides euryhalodurans TaxID=2518370 RepID=UPI001ABE75FE|nr:hypothetical protein [Nocardioides euryhalodurans]
MAFYDTTAPAVVACRGYLVTAAQLADVAAQELRRQPGGEFARELARLLPDVESVLTTGPGRYGTVVRLGALHGTPMFTITHHDVGSLPLAAPSAPYLRWISDGLREALGYDDAQVAGYLLSAPGIRGRWSEDEVLALSGGSGVEPVRDRVAPTTTRPSEP